MRVSQTACKCPRDHARQRHTKCEVYDRPRCMGAFEKISTVAYNNYYLPLNMCAMMRASIYEAWAHCRAHM